MLKFILSALLLISGCINGSPEAFATVSSNISKVIFAGDGVTTSVPFGTGGYSVPVYLQTDIQVYTYNTATTVLTPLTLNTNYTVVLTAAPYTLSNSVVYYTAVINLAGGSSPEGAIPSGTNLIMNRVIPYTNLLNITNYSSTPATTWNQGYDRATMLAQQLYTLTQQAVLQPVSATTPINIPSASNGYFLCWSGTSLANCANGGGSTIPVPITNTYLAALTAANLVNTSSIYGTTAIATAQGGTGSTANANAASGVVVLNGSSQLPAVSGALLTNTRGPVLSVTNSSTQSIGASSWTLRTFNTTTEDSGGYWASNAYTPLVAGYYLVTFTDAMIDSVGNVVGGLSIYKNGSAVTTTEFAVVSSTNPEGTTVTALVNMNGSSDYLQFYVYSTGSSTHYQALDAGTITRVY